MSAVAANDETRHMMDVVLGVFFASKTRDPGKLMTRVGIKFMKICVMPSLIRQHNNPAKKYVPPATISSPYI